jgi:hypothetical protein
MKRAYRFYLRHPDTFVTVTVLLCVVWVYGARQQHDEAMQARAAQQASR